MRLYKLVMNVLILSLSSWFLILNFARPKHCFWTWKIQHDMTFKCFSNSFIWARVLIPQFEGIENLFCFLSHNVNGGWNLCRIIFLAQTWCFSELVKSSNPFDPFIWLFKKKLLRRLNAAYYEWICNTKVKESTSDTMWCNTQYTITGLRKWRERPQLQSADKCTMKYSII